jgi:hypothetical protein
MYSFVPRLLTTTAVMAALFLSGAAYAGNGNGGGHGKGGKDIILLKKSQKGRHGKPDKTFGKPEHVSTRGRQNNKTICIEQNDGDCDVDVAVTSEQETMEGKRPVGATAASLQGLNGAVSASDIAMERTSDKSMLGKARAWRDAERAKADADAEITRKQEELAALTSERTAETIQAEIDALDPEQDAEKIALLEQEMETARTDAVVGADMNKVLGDLENLELAQSDLQTASETTYEDLTAGRTLTDEAVSFLRGALGLD